MKSTDLTSGLAVTTRGSEVDLTGIAYDSRKVQPGFLFAAWVGSKNDGHGFIAQAIEKGASAILCEHEVDTGSVLRILTKDARATLAEVARRFYVDPSAHLTMVGVTGTSGKTTTVHLIESLLCAAGKTAGIIGTLGTRYQGTFEQTGLTTPDAADLLALLSRMQKTSVNAVAMEVSSHALSQHRVAGVLFDVGVFTNLSRDHLDYHHTMEEYFAAKTRLFTERLKPDGAAVLNRDDPRVRTLSVPRALGFSLCDAQAEIHAIALELSSGGIDLKAKTPIGELDLHSPLVGRFNAENILAAAGVGIALGFDAATIAAGVLDLKAVPGRLELVSKKGQPTVLVDYAHKPDALDKVLQTAREATNGRLICVLGCGGDRDKGKREKMGEVSFLRADWTVITNDNPRSEDPKEIAAAIERGLTSRGAIKSEKFEKGAYSVELDREQAIFRAIEQASCGDTVLIAGKGHETYQIVGDQTLTFDDRVVARAALSARRARKQASDV